jgi:hypothetical protein
MAKHARSSRARRSAWPLVLIFLAVLVAVGLGAAALAVDDLRVLRAEVAAALLLAVVAVVAAAVTARSSGDQRRAAAREADAHRSLVARLEARVAELGEVGAATLGEVLRLREAVTEYLPPVAAEPDAVYPSLHLPLVRAAFSGEPADAQVLAYSPPVLAAEIPPTVSADGGAEGQRRRLLDLTAATQVRRHAAGA